MTHTPGPWHSAKVTSGKQWIFAGDTRVATANDANADLVTAAPDLLAALKSCIDVCERDCIGNLTLMRAAIAKAEGR